MQARAYFGPDQLLSASADPVAVGRRYSGYYEQLKDSYLENRSQFVGVDGSDSHKLPVLSGIPQGFVLGPLLFIAYINEVTSIISNGNLFTLPTITLLTASLKTPTIQCREMQLSAERDLVLFNHLL